MPRHRGRAARRPAQAAFAYLLTCTFAAGAAAAPAAGPACEGFGPAAVVGSVADPALLEVSGLAASRAHPDVLWAHNDSGAGPLLHALGPDGAALGAYEVPGASAVDWEDLAIGPGPSDGPPVLIVGDVGDNRAQRAAVTIHRVAEPTAAPDGTGGTLELLDSTVVTYPDGPVDVEALVADPDTGDVLLITKDLFGASRVLLVPADRLGAPDAVLAADVGGFQVPLDLAVLGGLPGTAVTGAAAHPDGTRVLVRTYQAVLVFERPTGEPLWAAFEALPCRAPQASEPQGEAVAFTAAGDAYFTISEGSGVPVHRVEVLRPEPPAPTTAPGTASTGHAPPSTPSTEASGPPSDDGGGDVMLLVGLLAGGGAAVGTILIWRRRRS